MPGLPAPGARELLRASGTAGSSGGARARAGAALPRESLRPLWKRQSPGSPQPLAPLSPPTPRSAARVWPLARCRFASGLWAASSPGRGERFSRVKLKDYPSSVQEGNPLLFAHRLFLFPYRLTFKSLPQISLSPSRQDFATCAAVTLAFYLLFLLALGFFFPFFSPVIAHSPRPATTGRVLPLARGARPGPPRAGHGPSGGQRRSAPASPSLPPPGRQRMA